MAVAAFDAVIIGGGPAGATAARLLARWGYSVAIVTTAPGKGPSFAECLPPSTGKLFTFLGIQQAIDRAGYFRTTGNTAWWGQSRRRVEFYPEGLGYQVLRSEFDTLLLDLARQAGATLLIGKAIGRFAGSRPQIALDSDLPASFLLDCSGRAGVLGRFLRVRQPGSRMAALCAAWQSHSGWKLPDPTHTLVESYDGGWAWSVPLSPTLRHVAVMVSPGKGALYPEELEKTRAFRRIFSHSKLVGAPWGRASYQYTSRQFAGPGFLLVGDAGSVIDPLSSFGVKKAMVSGWIAAVVVNTCLRRPAMQELALRFYEEREHKIYEDWRQLSASWLSRGGVEAFADDETWPQASSEAVRAAWEALRRQNSICLRRGTVPLASEAQIQGNEIVLGDAMLGEVNLVRLCEIADRHSRVPDLFEAYNRLGPPVALPGFLTALSTLVARGVLTSL